MLSRWGYYSEGRKLKTIIIRGFSLKMGSLGEFAIVVKVPR